MTEDALESEIEYIESNVIHLRVEPSVHRVLARMAQEEEWNDGFPGAVGLVMRRTSRQWFASLKFWERSHVLSTMSREVTIEKALRRLDVSGERLQAINRCLVKCEGLKSAVAQFERWTKEADDAAAS